MWQDKKSTILKMFHKDRGNALLGTLALVTIGSLFIPIMTKSFSFVNKWQHAIILKDELSAIRRHILTKFDCSTPIQSDCSDFNGALDAWGNMVVAKYPASTSLGRWEVTSKCNAGQISFEAARPLLNGSGFEKDPTGPGVLSFEHPRSNLFPPGVSVCPARHEINPDLIAIQEKCISDYKLAYPSAGSLPPIRWRTQGNAGTEELISTEITDFIQGYESQREIVIVALVAKTRISNLFVKLLRPNRYYCFYLKSSEISSITYQFNCASIPNPIFQADSLVNITEKTCTNDIK